MLLLCGVWQRSWKPWQSSALVLVKRDRSRLYSSLNAIICRKDRFTETRGRGDVLTGNLQRLEAVHPLRHIAIQMHHPRLIRSLIHPLDLFTGTLIAFSTPSIMATAGEPAEIRLQGLLRPPLVHQPYSTDSVSSETTTILNSQNETSKEKATLVTLDDPRSLLPTRTPSPTPEESAELARTGVINFKALLRWKTWLRKDWIGSLFLFCKEF